MRVGVGGAVVVIFSLIFASMLLLRDLLLERFGADSVDTLRNRDPFARGANFEPRAYFRTNNFAFTIARYPATDRRALARLCSSRCLILNNANA
jgi:hypothetical protein